MRMPDVSGWVLMMQDYGEYELTTQTAGKLQFPHFSTTNCAGYSDT